MAARKKKSSRKSTSGRPSPSSPAPQSGPVGSNTPTGASATGGSSTPGGLNTSVGSNTPVGLNTPGASAASAAGAEAESAAALRDASGVAASNVPHAEAGAAPAVSRAPLGSGKARGRGRWAAQWILPPLIILAGATLLGADYWFAYPAATPKEFVGSQSCQACHREQFEKWQGSHHDRAIEVPSPQSIEGDFSGATLEHYGITSRMFEKDGKYYISDEGPSGKVEEYEVKYTFGVHPLQQYLVEFPDGRLQAMHVAWDCEKGEWFYLDAEQRKQPPGDVMHWTGRGMTWNQMCAECHSTNVQRGFDLASKTFHTTFSEVDVACESCHGPGSMHLSLAKAPSLFWDRIHGYGLNRMKTPEAAPQLETCAPCHARRSEVAPGWQAGHAFLDHYVPELLDSDIYHPDGQIKPEHEGFEYGSFLQSKMFRKNIRCTDCHDPHTAQLKAEGNNLCAKCHDPARFNTPAHHHHRPDTLGANCVDCHMPHTTYMQVDPRRDHSIRVPRPDLSVKMGTPNACNKCHQKPTEDAAWAAGKVAEWYPDSKHRQRHFGEAIAAGRTGKPEAERPLVALTKEKSGDDDVGPIVRASAVALLGRSYGSAETIVALRNALKDSSPIVRHAAVCAYEARDFKAEDLLPVLRDPIRSVRARAGQVLNGYITAGYRLPAADSDAFHAALEEFKAGLESGRDRGGPNFGLGLIAAAQGNTEAAKQYYQSALDVDPMFQLARAQLSDLLMQEKKFDEAEAVLRDGVTKVPGLPDPHFSLGLFLATRPGREAEALAELAKAVETDPSIARFQYNYGLLLGQQGKPAEAEAALKAAARLEPDANEYLYALAFHYRGQQQWASAEYTAQELVTRVPGDFSYLLLLGNVKTELGKYAEAAACLRQAEKLSQGAPDVYHAFALLYEKEGKRAEALQAAQQALQMAPYQPEYQATFQRLSGG